MNTFDHQHYFYEASEHCISERIHFSEFNQEVKRESHQIEWGSNLDHSIEIHVINEAIENAQSIYSIYDQIKKSMPHRNTDVGVSYHLQRGARHFRRSDQGDELRESVFRCSLVLEATLPDGHRLEYGVDQFDLDMGLNFAARQLEEKMKLAVQNYEQSECLAGWNGSVIFTGQASGILIHELLGHLLEEDLVEAYHPDLKQKMGSLFFHPGLSLYDCPKLKNRFGSFDLDDEAQRSENVCLIAEGKLKNFLSKDLGRARGISRHSKPSARMSNTICFSRLPASLSASVHPSGSAYVEVRRLGLSGVHWPTHQYVFEIVEGYYHVGKGKKIAISKTAIQGSLWEALSQLSPLRGPLHWSSSCCQSLGATIPVSHAAPDLMLKKAKLRKFKHVER